MNLTYLRIELIRQLRNYANLFFVVVLPGFFFVIFGASAGYIEEEAGNGNVAAFIMISMAAYGAVTATVSIGGNAAVEKLQGWGRQLGITPITDLQFIATKAVVAVIVSAAPIAVVFALGYFTKAEADPMVWFVSAAILLVGAFSFALYGLSFGMALRSEAAVGAATGSVVVLAMLGNIFFPLSGWLLDVARFTPLYGYASLARYPLSEGWIATTEVDELIHEALWIPLTNVIAWTIILGIVATLLVRRSRARQ